jgi:pyridoxal phosphate enzyme (YggS family)
VSVAENLRRVRSEVAEAAIRAGRSPDDITIVGISKTHSAEELAEAVRAGLRHVGENRVQEAAAKFPTAVALLGADAAPPIFHLVGPLQTNKAGPAVKLFDRIDAVDSLKVAQALSRRLEGEAPLPILVEVYVGDDPRRPGVRPANLEEVVGGLLAVPGIRVEGLMTVAPLGGDARAAFNTVRELKDTLARAFPVVHFGVLSMGMSEDFVDAIVEGSTEVRIGTAIFGPRRSVGFLS